MKAFSSNLAAQFSAKKRQKKVGWVEAWVMKMCAVEACSARVWKIALHNCPGEQGRNGELWRVVSCKNAWLDVLKEQVMKKKERKRNSCC